MFLRFMALFAVGEILWYLFTGTFSFTLVFMCCIAAEILTVDRGYFDEVNN
jgi:hypothetical protein